MSDMFLFADIDYILDPEKDDSASIKLGTIIEYYDGLFWRFALRARTLLNNSELMMVKLKHREQMRTPYLHLVESIKLYMDPLLYQTDFCMYKLLSQYFPTENNIQAAAVFELVLVKGDTYGDLIEESFIDIKSPHREYYWNKLPI